jgi:hypothetical protein
VSGDLQGAFDMLWQQTARPVLESGVADPAGFLRHYVLIHDAACQGPEVLAAAQQRLRLLMGTLGPTCSILSINRGTGAAMAADPHLWADMLHGCVSGGGAGEPAERGPAPDQALCACLSEADISALRTFVHELAVRSILPHMEMRMRVLNMQVLT